jgi:hypothetical protein
MLQSYQSIIDGGGGGGGGYSNATIHEGAEGLACAQGTLLNNLIHFASNILSSRAAPYIPQLRAPCALAAGGIIASQLVVWCGQGSGQQLHLPNPARQLSSPCG